MAAVEVPALSVVMPVYNEAEGVADVITALRTNVLDAVANSELVVVDDCSTDGTNAIVSAATEQDPRIRLLVNTTNRGHGRSVRRAIDESSGRWILHVDSDGQLDVSEFSRLWSLAEESDLVLGCRVTRHDPLHRLLLTRVTRVLISRLAGRRVRDSNSPFKLIRRSLFDHLAPALPETVFAPSILIALGAHRCGARVTNVEVTHLARRHGRSSLHVVRLARAIIRCTAETLRFTRQRIPPYGHD